MDVADFLDLFRYNHGVRKSYLESLPKLLPWDELAKNRQTAWLSIKDTMLHIIWAEDTWINYSMQGAEDPHRPFPYGSYANWDDVASYGAQVMAAVEARLSSMKEQDLDRLVSRVNNDGIRRSMKARDVLMHVFTEEVHHRGEIIAMLWQMDVQPPDMGWASTLGRTNPPWHMK